MSFTLLAGFLSFASARGDTYSVTTVGDSGPGSLRQAITDANAHPNSSSTNPDAIVFNIPGTGVHTITPSSALPSITDPVRIDGYTQPGSKANTLAIGDDAKLVIELNGMSAGANASGLTLASGSTGSLVRGLVINRFGGSGVSTTSSDTHTIAGCFIGTDTTGTTALGNLRGVTFGSVTTDLGQNLAGGTPPADRNVISGNQSDGLLLGFLAGSGGF
ncbi:MAG: hypothetical protein M3Y69_06325, partial [Verrucomicrobiota bacterium]|nr:hypothetical protein [Verrucomicrobiota bacterium]